MKKLQYSFLIIAVLSTILIIYNQYKAYNFKHNPLSNNIQNKLKKKELDILKRAKIFYNINAKVKIIISNKMDSRLYGLTTLNKNKQIKIYLNKKRFKESENYMINNVLAHEYAHALMFIFGKVSQNQGGHTKEWIKICKNIGGAKCERFVNSHDIIINKRDIFK